MGKWLRQLLCAMHGHGGITWDERDPLTHTRCKRCNKRWKDGSMADVKQHRGDSRGGEG